MDVCTRRTKERPGFYPAVYTISAMCLMMFAGVGTALADGGGGQAGSLKTVAIPGPSNLNTYVRDKGALIALGKSLFWDMQTGNDGKQACATCHFHAGADHRQTNQTNPHGGPYPVNYALNSSDFPIDTGQVAGSQGVPDRQFTDVVVGKSVDDGFSLLDPIYSINGLGVRRVTGRNTPSVINAVFNVRNFWDGRAHDTFSVFTPFGKSDPHTNIVVELNNHLQAVQEQIANSSLASQSVGPPNNPVEMSSAGRNWPQLGKKMLSLDPLSGQRVHAQDGVLGGYANPGGTGLRAGVSYAGLIQAAFMPKYWSSTRLVDNSGADLGRTGNPSNTHEFRQMEYNFALFWGLAIQAYESTLVSDNAPVDQLAEGNRNALTALQAKGMNLFTGKGQCSTCHSGAEFSGATFTALAKLGPVQGTSGGFVTDTGFFRIGVRPVADDGGIAGTDGFGIPLSIAVQTNPRKASVAGAVKVPSLRNSEFTGPYFHNGGKGTLEQVVAFYSKGGDFPNDAIKALSLDASDQQALVAFLKSLSDERVRYEKAPFDHPQLCVPDGELSLSPGNLMPNNSADSRFQHEAQDKMVEIAEVGATGGLELQSFAELTGAPSSGAPKAHDLKTACSMSLGTRGGN